jgi:hypothetical protein
MGEPAEYRRIVQRNTGWGFVRLGVGFACLMACLMVMACMLPALDPAKKRASLGTAAALGFGLGIFAISMAWVGSRSFSTPFNVFDRGFGFGMFPKWKFSVMEEFAIFDCHRFYVLMFLFKAGGVYRVGIPEEFEIKALGAFLREKGLYQIPPAFPLDSSHPIGKAWLNFCDKLAPDEAASLLPQITHDVPPASLLDQTP